MAGATAPRTARLVGTYPPDDLAVIRADDASGLQPAKFGDSGQAQAGERAGLRPGDVIKSAGQAQTPGATALSQALAEARPGDKITVTASRGGQDRAVQVTLGELPGS